MPHPALALLVPLVLVAGSGGAKPAVQEVWRGRLQCASVPGHSNASILVEIDIGARGTQLIYARQVLAS